MESLTAAMRVPYSVVTMESHLAVTMAETMALSMVYKMADTTAPHLVVSKVSRWAG